MTSFSGAFGKRKLRKESLKNYRNLSEVKEGEEGRERMRCVVERKGGLPVTKRLQVTATCTCSA